MTDTGIVRQGTPRAGSTKKAGVGSDHRHTGREGSGVPALTLPATPDTSDIDWQLRFGEDETPEVKKFLGYE